jgi:hypothetical protein
MPFSLIVFIRENFSLVIHGQYKHTTNILVFKLIY